MFSLGSKAFFATTAFALACAVVYANVSTDRVGVVVLIAAGLVSAMLGVTALGATGAADRFAITGTDEDRNRPAGASGAPFVAALGLGAVAVGAAAGIELVVVGLVLLAVAVVVWFLGAWREHPAYARVLSPRISDRLTLPVGLPVIALVLILLAAFSISRTLLASSKNGATVVALVVALVVFALGFVLAARPALSPRFTNAMVFLGVVAVGAMLVVGLAKGEREFEEHENHVKATATVTTVAAADTTVAAAAATETTMAATDTTMAADMEMSSTIVASAPTTVAAASTTMAAPATTKAA